MFTNMFGYDLEALITNLPSQIYPFQFLGSGDKKGTALCISPMPREKRVRAGVPKGKVGVHKVNKAYF